MGGSSGWLTSDSKEELKKNVLAWYSSGFYEHGLYPRWNKKDFKSESDLEKEGIEFITVRTDIDEKVPIKIIETKDIPDGFYKGHMRKKDLEKKFACFVSAHT